MVSEEECPCTDATEASNIVSLQSDISCTIDSEIKDTRSETSNRDVNPFLGYEGFEAKECKCFEVYPPITKESYTLPGKAQKASQEKLEQIPIREFQLTSPCLCRAHKIAYNLPASYKKNPSSKPLWCRFKWKWPRKEYLERKGKTYEVKLKQNQCPHYAKPFISCEVSEGIPNKKRREQSKPKSPKCQAKDKKEMNMAEKIDIYYFDHGNSAYYRTTDAPPILATEKCAEKTDQAATRFWAEIFGTIHIGTAFVTAFILQFFRFVLFSIIRPLTVGILQLLADYFIKPFLSIIFNAIIQPVLILLYNIATSLRDLCEPLAEAMGLFLREVANLCAAIRLIEIKYAPPESRTSCT